jgi:ABC-type nickel/cobalt efflux system permease component RcnA
MKGEDPSAEYRNDAAKMRTLLAALRTLEAIRRSKLAVLRTGISVLAISITIITVLISTSSFWDPATVMVLLWFVAFLLVTLLIIGVFLFWQGLRGMRAIERQRHKLAMEVEAVDPTYEDIFHDH